jgi:valyl-tRNA synthetase
VTACLQVAGVIDIAAEKARLAREIDKAAKEIARIDAKLGNDQFLEKAPMEIIEEQREKRGEAVAHRDKLQSALDRLG